MVNDNVLLSSACASGGEPIVVVCCPCLGKAGAKASEMPLSRYNHYSPIIRIAPTAADDPLRQVTCAEELRSIVTNEACLLFSDSAYDEDDSAPWLKVRIGGDWIVKQLTPQ